MSLVEILKCDHSNESYGVVLPCGSVYYAVQGGSNFCLRVKSLSLAINRDHCERTWKTTFTYIFFYTSTFVFMCYLHFTLH